MLASLLLDCVRAWPVREESYNEPEKVPEDGLDAVPAHEDPDVVQFDVLIGNRSAEGVDEAEGAGQEAIEGQALSTPGVVKGFNRDDTLQWGVGEGVDDIEEEVESQRGSTG